MSEKSGFLWELKARTGALVGVGCTLTSLAGFALLTLFTSLKSEPVWVVGLAIAGALGLA